MAWPLLFIAALAGALGAPQDPEILKGIELFDRLDYDRAVVVLGRALTREGLPAADREAGLETLAFAYTILEDAFHAEETFNRLLDHAPEHEVAPSRSPRLRNAFLHARDAWRESRRLGFQLGASEDALEGAILGDPSKVAAAYVVTPAGRAPLSCDGARCRGPRPSGAFTVELEDRGARVLARAGPFELAEKPPAPAEDERPWWLYAAIAAVGLGAAVIAIGAASSGGPPDGSVGTIQLP